MYEPVPCQQSSPGSLGRVGELPDHAGLGVLYAAQYPAAEKVYEHRLVLVSTCKTEKDHEWRLDRAFAELSALGEESAEEYVSEEEEELVRTRPKRT